MASGIDGRMSSCLSRTMTKSADETRREDATRMVIPKSLFRTSLETSFTEDQDLAAGQSAAWTILALSDHEYDCWLTLFFIATMLFLKPWVRAEVENILHAASELNGSSSSVENVGVDVEKRRFRASKKQHVQCMEVDVKNSALKINDTETMVWCFVSNPCMKAVRNDSLNLHDCCERGREAEAHREIKL